MTRTAPKRRPHPVPTRLLILGMVDDDGTVHADRLFAVADAAGQRSEQVRSCLRRMMEEGLLEREGRGVRARYVTTKAGVDELEARLARARRAFTQDAHDFGSGSWDGRWRIIGFEVPERLRSQRDEFRAILAGFGATSIQGGVYVTPHAVEDAVLEATTRLGIVDHVFGSTTSELIVHGEAEPRRVAQILWQLDDLGNRYRSLLQEFRPIVARTRAMADRGRHVSEERLIPRTLSMASAYFEVYDDDPLLPAELLPQPWPGSQARSLITEARSLARKLRGHPKASTLFSFFDVVMIDPEQTQRGRPDQ